VKAVEAHLLTFLKKSPQFVIPIYVEVDLKTLDELPYVMGLVQQSFDQQMGDGGAE
jgi:hypothetical protein